MIAEGSPVVMKLVLGGHVDAILGVACLDSLEQMLGKVLLSGIPCMAVPLVRDGCRETACDEDWVRRMINTPHQPTSIHTRTYLHMMRCSAELLEPAELERLVPRSWGGRLLTDGNGLGLNGVDPIACTETIAYDFLASGGKHSRPFLTLAAYDALTGDRGTLPDGAAHVADIPDAVRRVSLAIEVFHKASLIHDDVEDDDAFRYGRPALHKEYGQATAINVGDFLTGLGYRLVAAQRNDIGAEAAADILAQFAQAHIRLCEGQGAEFVWRDSRQKFLKPLDALRIYALKTAPAFEAALLAGIRLAGPVASFRGAAARFSRHLGVGFQIINDLDDWKPVHGEKRAPGTDIVGARPTVLLALALERLGEDDRHELQSLLEASLPSEERIERADRLYTRADVYRRAEALVWKNHQRACEASAQIEVVPLRRLLRFIADSILDRRPLDIGESVDTENEERWHLASDNNHIRDTW
jgi:geranylgeranyl pyrophosphate synthase